MMHPRPPPLKEACRMNSLFAVQAPCAGALVSFPAGLKMTQCARV
jgi:hypothetical protein